MGESWRASAHSAGMLGYIVTAGGVGLQPAKQKLMAVRLGFKDWLNRGTIMLTTWLTTQILPGLISAASGVVFGVVVAGWDKIAAKYTLSKLGPSIKVIYNIIDPILDANLASWSGSDVDKAIELVINTVADGKLSPEEANKAVRLISELWLPQIATQKTKDGVLGVKELAIAEKIRAAVETKTLDTPELLKAVKGIYAG